MTRTRYPRLIALLTAAWLALSLTASSLHLFVTPPGRPPIPVLLSVLLPIAIFTVWYFGSSRFRDFLLGLNPQTVTLLHGWRVAGFAFVALAAYNILPNLFAQPAGWGDIAIGITAPFVAYRLATPAHRRTFILWQLLGMTDLVLAISLGGLSTFMAAPGAITATPMAVLPLSFIPTFGVPLLFILHIISIAQARRWSPQRDPNLARELNAFPSRTATN
jgi:hypothetical protein